MKLLQHCQETLFYRSETIGSCMLNLGFVVTFAAILISGCMTTKETPDKYRMIVPTNTIDRRPSFIRTATAISREMATLTFNKGLFYKAQTLVAKQTSTFDPINRYDKSATNEAFYAQMTEIAINLPKVTPASQITPSSACPRGCTYHPPGCNVKGNISYDTKEKIYHLPRQEYYDETVIDPAYGERWFCTEAEAKANGWRKALN